MKVYIVLDNHQKNKETLLTCIEKLFSVIDGVTGKMKKHSPQTLEISTLNQIESQEIKKKQQLPDIIKYAMCKVTLVKKEKKYPRDLHNVLDIYRKIKET